MQSNVRNRDSGRVPSSRVNPAGDVKHLRKSRTRKIPYKVGYTWNKGGRLKELRIRHLARKFLWLWMQNTFGRVLPQQAKSHYNSVILRRAFNGWRDEWWSSMREWSLTTRAECHYKYHLCALTFQHWQLSVPLQTNKWKIVHSTQSDDKHLMIQALDKWKVFTEMRRKKRRMLQTALELNKLETLHSAWCLWRTRLRQQLVLHSFTEQALKENPLHLEQRTGFWWKSEHSTAAGSQRENESKAAAHFDLKVKRKILRHWRSCAARWETKKELNALAQCFRHLRLLGMFWRKWTAALHLRQRDENPSEYSTAQHRDTDDSQPHMPLDEEDRIARQHYYQHLLRAGLEALSRNVTEKKRQRLNSNVAVQHHCQTLAVKHWKVWKQRLEEAKDGRLQPLAEVALTEHRTYVLGNLFHCWRDKLAELRHTRELSRRADLWFADRTVALCFKSWRDVTLQRRRHKRRREEAEGYDQQRRCAWAFYVWWSRAEEFQNQRLLEKIAIQQHDRRKRQTAWSCWRRRVEQRREKQMASSHMFLLLEALAQREGSGMEAQSRTNEEGQPEGDRRSLEAALDTWKEHNVQEQQLQGLAVEDRQQQRQESLCLTEIRFLEEQAHDHFRRLLQRKVLQAWRKATMCAVTKRNQQGEADVDAQRSKNQARLQQSSRCRRNKAQDTNPERTSMERARQHHESKLLFKATAAWRNYHQQCHKNKIRKRQGNLLLKLKMYQKYYEQWKLKMQRRRRESEWTERALWHWSLTLQAKVLRSWRLWLEEERGRKEQVAREAQVYRDQLLREGVSYILTYAAQMSDLTTTLTQYSEEQRSRRLNRVVRSCAMRWKQKALAKPQEEPEVRVTQPKKTVTFCLSATEVRTLSPCYSEEDEVEEHNDLRTSSDHHGQTGGCDAPPRIPLNIYSQNQPDPAGEDALLPPSAFMTSSSENAQTNACSSGFGDGFQQPPTPPETSSGETEETDSALIAELLSIQLDLKTYQRDKKQLQDWQKLRGVLTRWLQTSGKDDRMESKAVSEELQELQDRIARLTAELTERKPTVRLQAARVQRLYELVSELPPLQNATMTSDDNRQTAPHFLEPFYHISKD